MTSNNDEFLTIDSTRSCSLTTVEYASNDEFTVAARFDKEVFGDGLWSDNTGYIAYGHGGTEFTMPVTLDYTTTVPDMSASFRAAMGAQGCSLDWDGAIVV